MVRAGVLEPVDIIVIYNSVDISIKMSEQMLKDNNFGTMTVKQVKNSIKQMKKTKQKIKELLDKLPDTYDEVLKNGL